MPKVLLSVYPRGRCASVSSWVVAPDLDLVFDFYVGGLEGNAKQDDFLQMKGSLEN